MNSFVAARAAVGGCWMLRLAQLRTSGSENRVVKVSATNADAKGGVTDRAAIFVTGSSQSRPFLPPAEQQSRRPQGQIRQRRGCGNVVSS
jgi:hypothetical protein